jgi:hypothetical protein
MNRTSKKSAWKTAEDIAAAAQRAALMFHSQEVFIHGKRERGPLPPDCGTIEEILEAFPELQDTFFDEMSAENIALWNQGEWKVDSADPTHLDMMSEVTLPQFVSLAPLPERPTNIASQIAGMTKEKAQEVAHRLGLGKLGETGS